MTEIKKVSVLGTRSVATPEEVFEAHSVASVIEVIR